MDYEVGVRLDRIENYLVYLVKELEKAKKKGDEKKPGEKKPEEKK